MQVERINLQIKPITLVSKTVVIENFAASGIDINIEQKSLKNNALVIWKNLQQQENSFANQDEVGKKLQLNFDLIEVSDILVNVVASSRGSTDKTGSFDIPDLKLEDVNSEEIGTILTSEFISQLVTKFLVTVFQENQENLPNSLPITN